MVAIISDAEMVTLARPCCPDLLAAQQDQLRLGILALFRNLRPCDAPSLSQTRLLMECSQGVDNDEGI